MWYQECQHSLPLVTVALKGLADTHSPLAFGGIFHFLKRSNYVRSYTKEISLLILINILEFVTVIINYCAALHMVLTKNHTSDPYPVLLNVTNNASALSWTMGACRKSRIGRLLARFFCSLLINSPLGINSQWISTLHNVIANDISCSKTASSEYTTHTPLLTIRPSNTSTRSWVTALSSSQHQS